MADATDGGMVWDDFHALTDEDIVRAAAQDPDTFVPSEDELRRGKRASDAGLLSVEAAGEDIRRASSLLAEVQQADDLDERTAALAQRLSEMVRLSSACLKLLASDPPAHADTDSVR